MRDHLVFFINGVRQSVRGRDGFLSLADYLRRRLGLIGTKVVCSEGDCGACTVLVGRPRYTTSEEAADSRRPPSTGRAAGGIADAVNGDQGPGRTEASRPAPVLAHDGKGLIARDFAYRPVDACILFLFQLDGAHIVTVEGLRPDRELNAVQRAMIECHGSQCGFCTPGFVMSMTGLLEEHSQLDEDQLRTGLTGNLCRCTGYTPIVESGLACSADIDHERLNDLYPPQSMLEEFSKLRHEPIRIDAQWLGDAHLAICPASLTEALETLARHPAATIVAGATDVGVRINKRRQWPPVILDLNRVAELDYVHVENHELRAGARASWTSLLDACRVAVPELASVLSVFGAPQIRHVATIGGNLANASPVADSLPLLYIMEASLELQSTTSRREVNVNDFYRGYKQLDLQPGELITEVRIPLPAPGELVRLYKISRRRDLDIAGFTAGIRMRLEDDEATIAAASIALGAVGPTVLRARQTERFLVGRPLTIETMHAAGDVAASEATPLSDVRGTAEYRRQLTRNVLLKFFHQMRPASNAIT